VSKQCTTCGRRPRLDLRFIREEVSFLVESPATRCDCGGIFRTVRRCECGALHFGHYCGACIAALGAT